MMTALEQQETIVAQATAIGKGGVGIIRVSGADATAIAIAILGHCPAPRHAYYGNFHDNDGTKKLVMEIIYLMCKEVLN